MDPVGSGSGRILKYGIRCTPSVLNVILGKCFVDMKDDIQAVYAQYCRNHDSAIAVLEKVDTTFNNFSHSVSVFVNIILCGLHSFL